MTELETLKRQIVLETVAENVALIEGTRRLQDREQRARKMRAWRWTLFGTLLGISGMALASGSGLASSLLKGSGQVAASGEVADSQGLDGSESAVPVTEAQSEATDEAGGSPSRWATEPQQVEREALAGIDPKIFPLQVRRIVLDPGHGGEDLGTRNIDLNEKDITLDIANRLGHLLIAQGFEVSMTRTADQEVVLRERSDFANRMNADVFVSIHINWIVNRTTRGIETYYLGPTKDPELNTLAERENERSGYTLAEQPSLLLGMVRNAQHDRSRHLAERVQSSLFRSLREVNGNLKNRGVKTAPFVVLIGAGMPAILAEVSCLSNDEEVELLKKSLYKDHIAQALLKGILAYTRDVNPETALRLGP